MASVELRIPIVDEDILERDEVFGITMSTSEARINISNSTSVIVLNDDGECICLEITECLH